MSKGEDDFDGYNGIPLLRGSNRHQKHPDSKFQGEVEWGESSLYPYTILILVNLREEPGIGIDLVVFLCFFNLD